MASSSTSGYIIVYGPVDEAQEYGTRMNPNSRLTEQQQAAKSKGKERTVKQQGGKIGEIDENTAE